MFHSLHHLAGSMADAAKYVSPYATGLVGFAGGLITATFGKTATPKTESVNLKAYHKQIDTRLIDASVLNLCFIR